MTGARRRLYAAFCTAFALFWVFALLFRLPAARRVSDETYRCDWEDGTTRETYFSALSALAGVGADGSILIGREGKIGRIAASEAFLRVYGALEGGGLAELSSVDLSAANRLERAALAGVFGTRLWFSGGWLAWEGNEFTQTDKTEADEVVLLSGQISARRLQESGAKTLYLRSEAEFTASALEGTDIAEIYAEAPYAAAGGAVYLDTVAGTRLIAGAPAAKSLTVENISFADDGALRYCGALTALDVPFAGNTASGETGRGEFACLFMGGDAYLVPATLRRVRVRGGVLVSHAFYACGMLEEIDACGVEKDCIAADAFADCEHLKLLHTPRADVLLEGEFTSFVADCGCTIYTAK